MRVATIAVFACAFLGLVAPGTAFAAGSISGTVTEESAGHAPIERMFVCAFDESNEGAEECEFTDATGAYAITGLPAGEYTVGFFPTFEGLNYLYEYYDNKEFRFEATFLEVTTGAVNGIDAELTEGGQIHGKVINKAGGAAIAEVPVCAEELESPFAYRCAETDLAGEYTIVGVPTGEYKVEFWSELNGLNFVYQVYNGKASWSEGDPVQVTQGATAPNINAALDAGATITGTVTDAVSHFGVSGIWVCALLGEEEFRGCEMTGGGGGYTVFGLPAATYKVVFAAFGEEEGGVEATYRPQYYNGKATWLAADSIPLAPGATKSSVDAALVKKGAVVTPPPTPVVAPILSPPAHRVSHCKRGFRKKTVKGKQHCVKIHKKKHHRHKKHPARARAQLARLR